MANNPPPRRATEKEVAELARAFEAATLRRLAEQAPHRSTSGTAFGSALLRTLEVEAVARTLSNRNGPDWWDGEVKRARGTDKQRSL